MIFSIHDNQFHIQIHTTKLHQYEAGHTQADQKKVVYLDRVLNVVRMKDFIADIVNQSVISSAKN